MKFCRKNFENWRFFESAILIFFSRFFFYSSLFKSVTIYEVPRMGRNFDDYPGFHPPQTFQPPMQQQNFGFILELSNKFSIVQWKKDHFGKRIPFYDLLLFLDPHSIASCRRYGAGVPLASSSTVGAAGSGGVKAPRENPHESFVCFTPYRATSLLSILCDRYKLHSKRLSIIYTYVSRQTYCNCRNFS